MSHSPSTTTTLSSKLWSLRIPLLITHPSHPSPFLISLPRFSYLSLLLSRLTSYFHTPITSFHHETLLLRNLPLGLLIDLYDPPLPWRLTASNEISWDIADTFLNSVKEADFVRNGNAGVVMRMSKQDTDALWIAVRDNDIHGFSRVQGILLNPPVPIKNAPIRVYVPTMTPAQRAAAAAATAANNASDSPADASETMGTFKVIQSLVPLTVPKNTGASVRGAGQTTVAQTLGSALNEMIPGLFPSARDPIYGEAVMHGASVPLRAPVADLMREAAYPDGWVCLVIRLF